VKILVADDDSMSRMLMGRTLRQMGFDVLAADNGRDALQQLLSNDGPRLALLDWMMPELDGPEICRQVRAAAQERPYIYITLLTSKGSKEDLIAGLEAGADDYLTKPCHPKELEARLRTGQRFLSLEDKLVEAREEMRFKATHDALTSLWNRGAILEILERELQQGNPMAVLLCDVDHFKQINDTQGHLAGDAVLREVSSRLLRATRAEDFVGRYGGEEFLIVMGGCSALRLPERAESLRTTVLMDRRSPANAPLSVTVSIGAVAIEEGVRMPIEALLLEVDSALYQAKAAGRNRVIIRQLHI
jgi:diguanylate cyclase (GGDEF)-like protein